MSEYLRGIPLMDAGAIISFADAREDYNRHYDWQACMEEYDERWPAAVNWRAPALRSQPLGEGPGKPQTAAPAPPTTPL